MQNRNFWTEELTRWSRQQQEKKEGEAIKQFFSGQDTMTEEHEHGGSRELNTIAETGKLEDYEILEKLGQGADAAVYKARKGEQEFIVKVPLTDGESKTRLKNEMDISIKIGWLTKKTMESGWVQTPHIVQMLDCRKGDLTFAVLELLERQIEGEKKKGDTRIIRLAALEAAANEGQHATRAALYAWDTLHALEFMHEMDIAHRDVKYQNSMATHRNGKLASVLFDLGTALDLTNEEEAKKASIAGTPAYMPRTLVLDFWKYKDEGGFYANCPASRMKLILKRADYGSLAHSIAHLFTGTPPYSNAKMNGKSTSIFDACKTNADYIQAILNYEGSPIDYDRVREQPEGKMFAEIIEKLLDPLIVSKGELDSVREMLEKGMKMEGLFTRYRER